MKNIGKVLMVLSALIFACSTGEDDNTDNSNNGNNNQNQVTSITVITEDVVLLDQTPEIEIKVFSNRSEDLTRESVIYVNGVKIDGNTYVPSIEANYEVYAEYGDLTSPVSNVDVRVIGAVSLSFTNSGVPRNETITFKAVDDLGNEILKNVSYYVDDVALESNTFTTDEVGFYNVYATYNSNYKGVLTSETKPLKVAFSQKVLVEDYTGAWCGYCPRIAYKLAKAEELNPKVIGIGIHQGDNMQYSNISALINNFGITGFPTAIVNRKSNWAEATLPWEGPFSGLDNKTSGASNLGISIATSIAGSSLNVSIDVEVLTDFTGSKLVAYLLEDDNKAAQANYYNSDSSSPWYNTGNPIPNFVHDNVLIGRFTNDFGDTINFNDNTFNFSSSITLPNNLLDNKANLEIVAFVVNSSGQVINVEHAHLID